MHKVYASTGAFIGRPNGRDYRLIKEIAPHVSCDGFELMFYEEWYGSEDKIAGFLCDTGLKFPTLHIEKKIGELLAEERFSEAFERFEINCKTAKRIGASIMILHLWNGPISDTNIGANYSAFPQLEDMANSCGLTLTVENVIARSGSPLELWHGLRKTCPGVFFTYDTKMAEFDGDNIRAFDGQNRVFWPNVRHMHINDRKGGYREWASIRSLNIGEGTVDFDFVFSKLKEVGYSGDFTVEANAFNAEGSLEIDKLQKSVDEVRRLVNTYL